LGPRLRNLSLAGAAWLGLSLFAYSAYLAARTYAHEPTHNDFTYFYAGAEVGLRHGWWQLYDLRLQDLELRRLSPALGVAFQARYINPPPLAWLAAPFTLLPLPLAYLAWTALEAAAVVAAWCLSLTGSRAFRLAMLAVGAGLLPTGYALQLGQPSLLVAASVAGTAHLLRRGRDVPAGILLAAAVLKPQLVLLVPPALFLLGRRRALVAFAGTAGLLLGLMLLSLGPDGVGAYAGLLRYAESLPVNRYLVVSDVFGGGLAAIAVRAALAAVTLAAVWLRRAEGADSAIAIAIAGSLAAGPYLHAADMVMFVLAAWLYLRRPRPLAEVAWLAAGAVTLEIADTVSPVPFFIAEAGTLAMFLLPALGSPLARLRAAANPG